MIVNIISLLILALLAALFAWLATRAWRAKRAFIKWPAVILASLFALIFAAVTTVAVIGLVKMEARQANPVADLKIAGTPAPALKPFATGLSETQFFAIFRNGLRPDGSPVVEGMPWKNLGKTMSDDDLRAVQAYLKTLP